MAAAYFVGQDTIRAADRGGNLTLPLLAQYLGGGKGSAGGEILLGFIAPVAVPRAFLATKVWTSGRERGIEQMRRSAALRRGSFRDCVASRTASFLPGRD